MYYALLLRANREYESANLYLSRSFCLIQERLHPLAATHLSRRARVAGATAIKSLLPEIQSRRVDISFISKLSFIV